MIGKATPAQWIKFACLLAFPFVAMAVAAIVKALGWFSPRCPECRTPLIETQKTLKEPTAEETGLALRVRTCPQCGYSEEKQYTIERYQGATTATYMFGRVIRRYWTVEPWKGINRETVARSERDSAPRRRK